MKRRTTSVSGSTVSPLILLAGPKGPTTRQSQTRPIAFRLHRRSGRDTVSTHLPSLRSPSTPRCDAYPGAPGTGTARGTRPTNHGQRPPTARTNQEPRRAPRPHLQVFVRAHAHRAHDAVGQAVQGPRRRPLLLGQGIVQDGQADVLVRRSYAARLPRGEGAAEVGEDPGDPGPRRNEATKTGWGWQALTTRD